MFEVIAGIVIAALAVGFVGMIRVQMNTMQRTARLEGVIIELVRYGRKAMLDHMTPEELKELKDDN